MRWADPLPRFAVREAARLRPPPRRDRVAALTGLSEAEWKGLAELFPLLGDDPGRNAARARRTFTLVAWHELSRTRVRPLWDPAPPPAAPELLVTAHLGNLRLLRYFLRSAGVAVATIVDETHEGSDRGARLNAWIDRRFPVRAPHTRESGKPHRLRRALREGSLLAAIDRIHPPPPGVADRSAPIPFLGGILPIEPAAFRLARLAGVPARPVFATAPKARLTLTVGERLPADEGEAVRAFGEVLDRVARASPGDFDGFTHRFLARTATPGAASGRAGFAASFLP